MTARIMSRARGAAVAVVAMLALSACVFPGSGERPSGDSARSLADVQNAIAAVPGVAGVHLGGGPDSIPGQNEVNCSVVLANGYSGDQTKLVDYLLRQLWSENELKPTTTVSVDLAIGDPPTVPYPNLAAIASDLGLTPDFGTGGMSVGHRDMEEHYGSWPGPVPTLPAELAAVPTGSVNPSASSSPSP